MAKILLVEDNIELAEALVTALAGQEFEVEHLADGSEAIFRLKFYHFDLAILDWNLPGTSGVDICKEYRQQGGSAPILMLTGKNQISEKEEAFAIGADDYLTKPFILRELLARVKALLRRPPALQDKTITVGRLTMDLQKKRVTAQGKLIDLKPAEFTLMELLMKSPGRVFSSDELLAKLYPSDSEATDNAIRQRINRLRRALGEHESMIVNLVSLGYKLSDE